jgi:predicted  nucleic acid-binding Zn-ribbon protein
MSHRDRETTLDRVLKAVGHIHTHVINLGQQMENIMSAIQDFAAKMKAFTVRQDAAVTALQGDVKTLEDKITELQNSGGGISAEDQALLDEIQTHASAIADKLDALDALTPPAPPAA